MRRLALALVVLALMAGGIAFAVLDRGRGEESMAGAPATSDAVAAPVAVASEAGAAPVAREPATNVAEGDAPLAGLRVFVVDGATGRPEADAEVLFTPAVDPVALSEAEHRDYQRLSSDVEACARRFGVTVHTGIDGRAVVPWSGRAGVVIGARHGARYGEARNEPDGEDTRIELWPDRTLRALVVGPGDEPLAGVVLELAVQWPDASERQAHRFGESDAAGLVVMPHFPLRLAAWQRIRSGPPVAVAVLAEIPGLDHAGVPLDVRAIPEAPVRVPIPATGRIAVELWRAGGIAPLDVSVNLRDESESPLRRSGSPRVARHLVGKGSVEFRPVGLGGRFRVQVAVAGLNLPPQEGPGPLHPGEVVTFRFEFDEAEPILQARLLDATGAACRDQRVNVSMGFDHTRAGRITRTDAEGVVRIPLDRRLRGRTLFDIQFDQRRGGRSAGLMARAEPGRTVAEGVLELGDLTLAVPPLVVAGTVTDEAGNPVDVATPEVCLATAAHERSPPPLFVSAMLARHAFTIRGFVPDEELALVCRWGGFAPIEPVFFRRGAADLRIVVRRLVRLDVIVRHDMQYDAAKALRIEVIDDAGRAHRPGWGFTPLARDRARIGAGELPPGRYTVHVRLPYDPVPLATIADVDLAADGPRDPRLREVDIRGRLRAVLLTLLDPLGQPVRAAGSLHLRGDTHGVDTWLRFDDGSLRVPIGSRPVSGTLRVAGFRDLEVREVDGDRTVHLDAPLEVRVRLTPMPVLPAGFTLHAFARPKGQPPNPLETVARLQRGPIAGSGTRATTGAEPGSFVFALSLPGDYEFLFVLSALQESMSVALPATPVTATVPQAAEIAFSTDDADVQRAVAELQR